jgi:cellulose biosynthesis protein BcsQ
MVVGIIGKDGVGKSTFAGCLGHRFSKEKTTLVIDADLMQPTLPARFAGSWRPENSLGKYIAAVGPNEVLGFMHQHPDDKWLFYAGTVPGDNILTYAITDIDRKVTPQIEKMRTQQAQYFLDACAKEVDNVIVDCPVHQDDFFMEAILKRADYLITLIAPELNGAYWMQSMECIFAQMDKLGFNGQHMVIAGNTTSLNDLFTFETLVQPHTIAYSLPYSEEVGYMSAIRELYKPFKTPTGKAYKKTVDAVYKAMADGEHQR